MDLNSEAQNLTLLVSKAVINYATIISYK